MDILARVCEIVPLEKGSDAAKALETIKSEFSTVTDFEREFPSLCFALATGVGKTRLMGAFIAYLTRAEGVRHFFVLAPNLTIYNKLVADFTPGTAKYVFQGIAEFAMNPPEIITGDNYESGRGVRGGKLFDDSIHINIFNISKINSEVRGDKAPRIKRLSEYIGESYFDYLSKLDDLVLLMDESHRYRASAGVKAINELKPILGLELTATPQVEKGTKAEPFSNVIYSYPLSEALKDGFVKEPAVATRENFDAKNYSKEGLEKLKLEDGIHVHEETKTQLELYSRENNVRRVKPFMLVVAEDTTHASAVKAVIEDPSFFGGQYKGKVIEVHSQQKGVEKDENVQLLLSVEEPENPVEIVIHVNMLKEGWDVTNLYTIVPLRAANSRTLVEQSIGRGLRLPYGKRTGVPAVDRLTIVSHDRFQEIVDEANRPGSIIRTGIVIGRDIPLERTRVVVAEPKTIERLIGSTTPAEASVPGVVQKPLFTEPQEQKVAQATLEVLREFERLPSSADLKKPEVLNKIVERVTEVIRPSQAALPGMMDPVDVAKVVAQTIDVRNDLSIDIPRIIVTPRDGSRSGFREFELDCKTIRLQPVSQEILIQHLQSNERFRLRSGDAVIPEQRLEDYLVRGLMDFDDINYDEHAQLLYKLAGQMVKHLQSYLKTEDEVLNVLQAHQQTLVQNIHSQMQNHFEETATEFDVQVSRGFITLRPNNYSLAANEKTRNFHTTVDDKLLIRGMLFDGFQKSLYSVLKFQSNPERIFAVILEGDKTVEKWLKPSKGDFRIYYAHDDEYVPDFAVETNTVRYLCEPKSSAEMKDETVLAKARAASLWCQRATEHAGGKPWKYLLIPHNAIDESKTLAGLAATWEFHG
ncbi:MAG: DEAD/DEAH box helicase family protein [Planctomycetes bacterium]|nr:DEAD/DEAH box helicase family protein [Planctomycetota bacterium]